MNKSFFKNFSIKKGFITGVIVLVIINILFISVYYRLFLNSQIENVYKEFSLELEEKIDEVLSNVNNMDNPDKYLEEVIDEEKLSLFIYNENNELVRKYAEGNETRNKINISRMIGYNGKYYLVNITQKRNVINLRIALNFLLFEIFNIFALAILGIVLSNFKLLEPITSLSRDFNNYKLGIIPKKKNINGEIDRLQNDFVDLVNSLEEEHHNQSRIIASISHDIKTPLTSILGYSERIITNSNLSDETKMKYANTIYNKALSLKEIVEEFDDYLRCNIKDDNKKETISIKYIVEYLMQYYKEDLKEKEIDFKIKCNCPNLIIEVDLAKFKRIFSNVITNSIRHFDKKKKVINIYINEQKDDTIMFEIADNGSGCTEDMNKIFEPLYTTDKSRKISGLGLSICKEIVESHGGSIKAINNKMNGFSVIFYIKTYKEETYEGTDTL